jgi:hypothetical protein
MKMSNKAKYTIITIAGLLISILPPLVTTLYQFPTWIRESAEATVSGVVVFFGILSFVPLYKKILHALRSPSAPIMWTVIAVFLYIIKDIADEMFLISTVGAISNFIGWTLFKFRRKYRRGVGDERA